MPSRSVFSYASDVATAGGGRGSVAADDDEVRSIGNDSFSSARRLQHQQRQEGGRGGIPAASSSRRQVAEEQWLSSGSWFGSARWGLQQVRWLLYQALVLATVMGVGIRWVWMLARTIAFGCIMANGFVRMFIWYLMSPYTIRRVRYSEKLVRRTPIKLENVLKHRGRGRAERTPTKASTPGRRQDGECALHGRDEDDVLPRTPSTSETSTTNVETTSSDGGEQPQTPVGQQPSSSNAPTLNAPPQTLRSRVARVVAPTPPGGKVDDDSPPPHAVHNGSKLDEELDSDDPDADLNNRAYLDIHLPVPVDTLLGSRGGVPLSQAKPPASSSSMHKGDTQGQRQRRRATAAAAQRHAARDVELRHAADVCVPPTTASSGVTGGEETTTATFPVIICVTGGAWIIGVHFWMAMMARVLSACGFVVVTPDYRNFPAATIPAMIDDVDDAIAWTIANIHRFHGDPCRIYVLGQSAGAHLVTMSLLRQASACHAGEQYRAAVQRAARRSRSPEAPSSSAFGRRAQNQQPPAEAAPVGAPPPEPRYDPRRDVRAFIGLSGMYDLSGMSDYLHTRGLYRGVLRRMCGGDVNGCSALAQLCDADAQAVAKWLPAEVMFVHGNADTSAPPSESEHMAAVLQGKIAEARADVAANYGAAFARQHLHVPNVRLHVMAGATHTTPIVEDFLAGRSEVAAMIVALAKRDYASMLEEATAASEMVSSRASADGVRGGGGSASPHQNMTHRGAVDTGSGSPPRRSSVSTGRHADSAESAAIGASFVGMAGSQTLSSETIAALQRTLLAKQQDGADGSDDGLRRPDSTHQQPPHHHHYQRGGSSVVLKFRPMLWRWQADLASFVSAF